MKHCVKLLSIIILFVSSITLADELRPYQTPGSILHEVNSKIVGQVYELAIGLPPSYATDKDKTYPVVYIMDGQWNFSIIQSIAGKMLYDGLMPEVIIVGVTWGGEGADAGVLRARDYTPSAIPRLPNSGGGKKFLSALEKELIPFIEKRYRNNEERVITGSSLGGLIVGYALLEQPQLFNKYIASAGAFRLMSDELRTKKLSELTDSKLQENTRIYIGCGKLDQCQADSKLFSKQLKALNLSNLEVKLQLVDLLGHAGVEPISYTYGLEMAFRPPFFAVSDKVLSKYTGSYKADNGLSVEVIAEKNGLFTRDASGVEMHWLAESNTKFYIRGMKMTAKVIPTNDGSNSIVVTAQGRPFTLVRVK